MRIRTGYYKYEQIIEMVEEEMVVLEDLYKTSTLQNKVDLEKINQLMLELL